MNKEYISVHEAAKILGVSQMTIRNFLIQKHYFIGKKFGKQYRIDKESFEYFIENSNV